MDVKEDFLEQLVSVQCTLSKKDTALRVEISPYL